MRPATTLSALIGTLAAASLLTACQPPPAPPPPTTIRISTGSSGGGYDALGSALAAIYTEQVPGIKASVVRTRGFFASRENVEALERGEADIGIAQADVAYLAYKQGTAHHAAPYTRLRAMGVLFMHAVHVIVRKDSEFKALAELRGHRVVVGPQDGGAELAARVVLEGFGLTYGQVNAQYSDFDEAVEQLRLREVDALFLAANYPNAALVQAAARVPIRLLPLDGRETRAIRMRYPFYKPVILPKGAYPGVTDEVRTIGKDNLLICRDDLPVPIVSALTRALYESLPELRKVTSELMDADDAPASALPLHEGAAQYYRQRELLRWIWSVEGRDRITPPVEAK